MHSVITSTFNSVQLNYVRNSRAIAVLWFVSTVCFTIINIIVFLNPWLGDTAVIDKEGYFGLFEFCKYTRSDNLKPSDIGPSSQFSKSNNNYNLVCDGSWILLSSALNPIATFSIGFSAVISLACIATFLVLLIFVTPSIVFAICGFLQIISTMFMILGCVIYPNNWDDPRIVDICETSRSYSSGKCEIKWAYILSIVGIFDVLFLGILALVMSRRQANNYRISSFNNLDYDRNANFNPELSQNISSKYDSNSFRDFQI